MDEQRDRSLGGRHGVNELCCVAHIDGDSIALRARPMQQRTAVSSPLINALFTVLKVASFVWGASDPSTGGLFRAAAPHVTASSVSSVAAAPTPSLAILHRG